MRRRTMANPTATRKPKATPTPAPVPAPWTGARIARVRRSIREAFEGASIWASRYGGEETEAAHKQLDAELAEALALVGEFARERGLK